MIETENEDDFFQRLSLQIDPKQEAVRIDKYLSDRLGKISRNRIQQAIKAESVLVNDLPVKSNYKIRPGNLISAVFPRHFSEEDTFPWKMRSLGRNVSEEETFCIGKHIS